MSKNQFADHSDVLKLDLQFFSDEDAILPEDFQAESQVEEPSETIETPAESGLDTIETEGVAETAENETPIDESPKIKVKYNHEEQEIPYEEAVPLIQKGMNYDKLQEKLQSLETDPRLQFVEELAAEEGMDVQEYLEAVQTYREQQKLNELIQQNIPEELAQEILESRKDREARKQQEQMKAAEEKKNAEYQEFFDFFRQTNGKEFVPNEDEIPQEVWDANANGVPLKYAYMEHHNNQLRSQLQVLKQNEENARKAPVSGLSIHGGQEEAAEDDFLRGFNSI